MANGEWGVGGVGVGVGGRERRWPVGHIHVFAPLPSCPASGRASTSLRRSAVMAGTSPAMTAGRTPCRREGGHDAVPSPPHPHPHPPHSPFAIRHSPLAKPTPTPSWLVPPRRSFYPTPTGGRRSTGGGWVWHGIGSGSGGAASAWTRKASIRGRCCSMSCGCRSAASAPRKAARRATAAPARWRSDGSGTGGCGTSRQRLHPAARPGGRRRDRDRRGPRRGGPAPRPGRHGRHHGSQCGFCAPGIVMSLFALYQEAPRPVSREVANDALAGNLCRCTGTCRPIVDAALEACAERGAGRLRGGPSRHGRAPRAQPDAEGVFVGDAGRFFSAPASEAALARLCRAPGRDARRRFDRRRPASPKASPRSRR